MPEFIPPVCRRCRAPIPEEVVRRGPRRKFCSEDCSWRYRHEKPDHRLAKRAAAAAAHRAKALAGLCVDSGCAREPVPGKTRCRAHLDALNARTRAAKQRHRELSRQIGRCHDCSRPAVVPHALCAECLARANDRPHDPVKYKARYEERKRLGLCVSCRDPAEPPFIHCARHRAEGAARGAERYAADPAKHIAALAALYARRKAARECVGGCGRKAVAGLVRCPACHARAAETRRRWVERKQGGG